MDAGATGGHGFQATMQQQETGQCGLRGRDEGWGSVFDVSAVKDRERVPYLKVHLWRQQLPPPPREVLCVLFGVSCVAGGFFTV